MKLPKLFARKQTRSVERLDAFADKGVRMSGGKEKTSVSTSHEDRIGTTREVVDDYV